MTISRRKLLTMAAPIALVGAATGGALASEKAVSVGSTKNHSGKIEKRPLVTSLWGIKSSESGKVNATRLNKLIAHALATGRAWIDVDEDAEIDDVNVPVRKKTEVFFRHAGGELLGLYRRATIPSGAPSNGRIDNGLVQSGMDQFYSTDSAKILIMGDSLSTYGPNALSNTDCMFSIISNKIRSQNRDREINIVNMSIGGQTYMHANSKPTVFPSWYKDKNIEWLDYVKDEAPDLLILAFGMNDSNGFNAGALHVVMGKINSWEKVPSIIFVTNPVPSMATTWGGGQGFYDVVFQEGRDKVAGYVRSYAKFYGHSVIDINRQFCLLRDGRDYINPPLNRVGVYKQSYINNQTVSVRDFTVTGEIASWPSGKSLSVKVGLGDHDIILISNYDGYFKINAYCEGLGSHTYIESVTKTPVKDGQSFNLGVQNNQVILFVDDERVISFSAIRSGGEFNPVLEWSDESNAGPFSSVEINAGNWLQCQYTAKDSDIWGHDDGTPDTNLPEGGNGINHYSSNGLSLVVAPVVEAFDFSKKVCERSTIIAEVASGVNPLSALSAKRLGSMVSLAGKVSSSQKGSFKLFDLPLGFRPKNSKIVTAAAVGTSSWDTAIIEIRTDGSVYLASGNIKSMLSLDGVFFFI